MQRHLHLRLMGLQVQQLYGMSLSVLAVYRLCVAVMQLPVYMLQMWCCAFTLHFGVLRYDVMECVGSLLRLDRLPGYGSIIDHHHDGACCVAASTSWRRGRNTLHRL
jgi:hypothetical protein